jgi:hypothetical protein
MDQYMRAELETQRIGAPALTSLIYPDAPSMTTSGRVEAES